MNVSRSAVNAFEITGGDSEFNNIPRSDRRIYSIEYMNIAQNNPKAVMHMIQNSIFRNINS